MPTPFFRLIVALVLLGGVLPATPSRAQAACDDLLIDEADRFYDLGRFDEAVGLLRPCLPRGIRPGAHRFRRRAQATRALRLMALSNYAMRQPPDSTSQWVRGIVKIDRRYQADPEEDPQYFQDLVEALRPPKWYQKTWVQIGGGFVVGSVVSYLLFKPGPETLPGPEDIFTPPGN